MRKIWPWSPAFASGSLVVHDILVSIDGENVDEMELSDVRAMLRGEEGSTVILETLHLVKGVDFEPDKVTQRYIELERSVDYLRRDPIPPPRIPWPDRRKYQDRAFFCLSLESWPRRACIYLIESRAFQAFSMLLILGSSVLTDRACEGCAGFRAHDFKGCCKSRYTQRSASRGWLAVTSHAQKSPDR